MSDTRAQHDVDENDPPASLIFTNAPTERGFPRLTFVDLYDSPCSVQLSSLATDDAIWLGIDDVRPSILAAHAERLGISTDATCGWIPYPLAPEVILHNRMHLTRSQVAALLPVLQKFVDDGEVVMPLHLGREVRREDVG